MDVFTKRHFKFIYTLFVLERRLFVVSLITNAYCLIFTELVLRKADSHYLQKLKIFWYKIRSIILLLEKFQIPLSPTSFLRLSRWKQRKPLIHGILWIPETRISKISFNKKIVMDRRKRDWGFYKPRSLHVYKEPWTESIISLFLQI